jgi:hypothetical protein
MAVLQGCMGMMVVCCSWNSLVVRRMKGWNIGRKQMAGDE